jgi:eukaryotic-like serine/threonine-protein kinase
VNKTGRHRSEKAPKELQLFRAVPHLAFFDAERYDRVIRLLADVDWVVIKALEKDRNRRYDTPGSFAEDIDRYLRHEAISARPPSQAYRLKKFVRRNRPAVLTAAVVTMTLLAGIAVSTWHALRATRAEKAALVAAASEEKAKHEALAAARAERKAKDDALAAAKAERKAKKEALVAAAAERKAKNDAVQREAETKAVLGFLGGRIIAVARPMGQEGGLGRDVTLRHAVESALPYVKPSFPNQPLIEAQLRLTLGQSFYFLGDARTATEQLETAKALYTRHRGPGHPDTLNAMNYLGNSYYSLGRYGDALKVWEETLSLRKATFGPDHPDTLTSMNNAAVGYDSLGRYAEALKLREQALALRREQFGPFHPQTLESFNNLGACYYKLGRFAESLKLAEHTLALQKAVLGPDHPDTLIAMGNVADSCYQLGRLREAVQLNEETLALRRAKLGANHPDTLTNMVTWLTVTMLPVGRAMRCLVLRGRSLIGSGSISPCIMAPFACLCGRITSVRRRNQGSTLRFSVCGQGWASVVSAILHHDSVHHACDVVAVIDRLLD